MESITDFITKIREGARETGKPPDFSCKKNLYSFQKWSVIVAFFARL
jgi:hypothetical protein